MRGLDQRGVWLDRGRNVMASGDALGNVTGKRIWSCLMAALLAVVCLSVPATAGQQPNVLVIYTDDHGWADLGVQGVDADIRTPHIDQLAQDGVRFTRGYVTAPQCVPSRAGLITGIHQNRFGVEDNLKGPLPLEVVTLPERLQRRGYVTGMSGKWHLDLSRGERRQPGRTRMNRIDQAFLPHTHGFDEYWRGELGTYLASHALDGTPLDSPPAQVADKRFRITVQTEAALSFLQRRAAEPEQPWFLYLPWFAPHVPLESAEPWFSQTSPELPLERRQALAMIAAMDEGVGQIREKLRAMGQEDDTLIFFISDNGAPLKEGAWNGSLNLPLVGEKGMLTDGGVRVPFVAAWPTVLPPGLTYDAPVSSLDVAATAVALAGSVAPVEKAEADDGANKTTEQPSDAFAALPLEGVDLMPYLIGGKEGLPHESLYWRWRSQAAVLAFPWKLIRLGREATYLFDVSSAEGETVDRSSEHPEIVERLTQQLDAWAGGLEPPGPEAELHRQDAFFFETHVDQPAAEAAEVETKTSAASPPNIVFVIADDLTFREVGCYGGQAHTPHIDRLATEGMRFTRCFQAAPMCSPTRHTIYTGLYPVKSGAYPNHTFAKDGTRSVCHALGDLGYRVALSGKTHIGPQEVFPFEYSGQKNPDMAAIDQLMAESKAAGQPFCLFACSNEPHSPWNKGDPSAYPPEDVQLPPYHVDTPETRDGWSRYLAEISYFDGQVGEILALLEKHDLASNTLVVVTTEQGNSMPFAKWTLYDAGLQTALIVRWPGMVEPGAETDAMVEYVDMLPTFVEAAGGTPDATLDGRSFLPLLRGEAASHKEHVYGIQTTRGTIDAPPFFGIRSVRSDRYKLIVNLTPEVTLTNACTTSPEFRSWVAKAKAGDADAAEKVRRYQHRPAVELYDLKADPFEWENLADQPEHAATVAMLRAKLEAWMTEQGDQGQATELAAGERQRRGKR
jgi:N-sulfoglucosamine sulfohydrolase